MKGVYDIQLYVRRSERGECYSCVSTSCKAILSQHLSHFQHLFILVLTENVCTFQHRDSQLGATMVCSSSGVHHWRPRVSPCTLRWGRFKIAECEIYSYTNMKFIWALLLSFFFPFFFHPQTCRTIKGSLSVQWMSLVEVTKRGVEGESVWGGWFTVYIII